MIHRLNDFATVQTGLVTARKKAQFDSLNHIKYEQIGLRCFTNSVKLDRLETDMFVASVPLKDKYLTKEGDVLVRLRSPSSALYIDKENEGLLISSLLAVIRTQNEGMNSKYLAYYINARKAQQFLQKDIKGTRISMLKTKDLEYLELVLPSLEEQEKLVKYLDTAEEEQVFLASLAKEKQKLSQEILNITIEQNKEKN